MKRIDLPPNPRILVIALRRLGDVLLMTPLTRSIKRAWPDARIDALVFADTVAILDGNPDLDRVITLSQRPSLGEGLALARRLWRRYALAVSTQAGDRPTFFAFISGDIRVGLVEDRLFGRLKRLLLHRGVPMRPELHRVCEVLNLADALGIDRAGEVVCPRPTITPAAPGRDYAVIHAAPMFRYKQWTDEGWRGLAAALDQRGLAVVTTGGPGEIERQYLDGIWQGMGFHLHRLDGCLTWPELTSLLAGARVYVGPDTSVTHLAAAAGCPTVALYGPTDPRLWGPWPTGGLLQPWSKAGSIQRRGNVWLVQNPLSCLPCQQEGCERRLDSYSQCLDELPLRQVLAAVDQALAPRDI